MRKPRERRTFYYWLNKFPPFLVRLLARVKHGPPLSTEQIAQASGLPVYEVITLSQLRDWKNVDVETVRRFTSGCGLDLDDPKSIKRKTVYLRGKHSTGEDDRVPPRFSYLRRSPEWKTFYRPLIERLRQMS